MKMSQLRTIIIVILVIVNIFLMAQVIPKEIAEKQQRQEEKESLVDLLARSDITIDVDAIPDDETLPGLIAGRDVETEARAVEALIGESEGVDMGGGIFAYTSESGTAMFYTGGEFDIVITGESTYNSVESVENAFKGHWFYRAGGCH